MFIYRIQLLTYLFTILPIIFIIFASQNHFINFTKKLSTMIDDYFFCVYLGLDLKGIFQSRSVAEELVSSLGDKSFIAVKWFKTDMIPF